ncbi:hypothetical protein F4778DRAFT_380503 [Xylariomycetidae sp. FL2044]|nr:hypothetical protein F4778DRAFT_380503 [Xylariomycetidae sp. FL2044]
MCTNISHPSSLDLILLSYLIYSSNNLEYPSTILLLPILLRYCSTAFSSILHSTSMEASYDFVIIGGGTAGLTIAARLSEIPKFSVAVVEAGSYYQITNPLLSSIPACAVASAGTLPSDNNPNVDWSFVTTPQEGLNNRKMHYARGKCLGGSSGRHACKSGTSDFPCKHSSIELCH